MASLHTLVNVAQAYSDMGWSVQEQCKQALGGDWDDLNPNALRLIVRWLKQVERLGDEVGSDAELLRQDIEEYLADLTDGE